MEILATLHPDNNPNDDLFPNVKKENIPSKAINLDKLSGEVKNKLPKVISSDTLLPATKLKYLEIDGITYYIPQRVDVTSNIKITGNKNDILSSPKNLLCILNDTSSLAIKVVDKIEGGSEELSTLSEVIPKVLSGACCATYNENIYIFGGYSSNGYSNTIFKFNTITKMIETLSVTLPQLLGYACCSIKGDNIYIFGGFNGTSSVNVIYKFNCTNETIETLSVTFPQALNGACCATYGDNIYIFGGYNGTTYIDTIYKFNCTTKTIETLSVTLPQILYGDCCSIYNDNIYIFGGYNPNNSYLDTIYKFNCTNEIITTLNVKLPKNLQCACCSSYNDNIYIFGGLSVSSNYLNTIYEFNCSNETIETLSVTLPQLLGYACCSIKGGSIYIFGGQNSGGKSNKIYNFSVSFELTANNVLIYNANSNYSFDLITDQVTIPIKNIYIGDNNNMAQLASAYLYDESQTAWVNVNTGEVLTL